MTVNYMKLEDAVNLYEEFLRSVNEAEVMKQKADMEFIKNLTWNRLERILKNLTWMSTR